MASASSATIVNNIINIDNIASTTYIYNSTVHNNIFYTNGITTSINNELKNNLFDIAGTDVDGNQYGVDMSAVFEGTGSTDGQWQLKAGSVAIGAALDGGECGVFGGSNPYRLSGMPAGPYIYDATIPTSGSATSGLPVQIKIRSNN